MKSRRLGFDVTPAKAGAQRLRISWTRSRRAALHEKSLARFVQQDHEARMFGEGFQALLRGHSAHRFHNGLLSLFGQPGFHRLILAHCIFFGELFSFTKILTSRRFRSSPALEPGGQAGRILAEDTQADKPDDTDPRSRERGVGKGSQGPGHAARFAPIFSPVSRIVGTSGPIEMGNPFLPDPLADHHFIEQ